MASQAMNLTSTRNGTGFNGTARVAADTIAERANVARDVNLIALGMVIGLGVVQVLVFGVGRLWRWGRLRKPVKFVGDKEQGMATGRSTAAKVLGWPGRSLRKISLTSFVTEGVPPLGMILLISIWMMINVGLLFFKVEITLVGIALRLPLYHLISRK
jgi:hypothetical protein